MKKILIAGNGITAEIICAYLRSDSRYEVVGLAVEDEYANLGAVNGYQSFGLSSLGETFSPATHSVIVAIGYDNLNQTRERIFFKLRRMGYGMEPYIHPDAKVYDNRLVGIGCVVLPGAVIEPNATVGINTMVWSNVTLAHHCQVGDHCWIAAGTVVSGQAKVLDNTFLGVNSTIVDGVTVSEFNVVGASAMISKNTKPHTVHLARSAELIRYSAEDYVKHFGI